MCLCSVCVFFFFFKQKTAYEMRISDWSSDVCSSDLLDVSSSPACRIVVLISGRGSNMQTIVNTVQERSLPAAVSAVIANKADAAGLEWAQARGIRTAVEIGRG